MVLESTFHLGTGDVSWEGPTRLAHPTSSEKQPPWYQDSWDGVGQAPSMPKHLFLAPGANGEMPSATFSIETTCHP